MRTTSKTRLNRRRLLQLASTFTLIGSAGCLRLTTDPQAGGKGSTTQPAPTTTATVTNAAPNANTESNAASDLNGLFASQSEALAYASQFANDTARKSVQSDFSEKQKLLRFTGAGTSGGGVENEGRYSSQDIQIESRFSSSVAFGANSNRTLQIRNVTFGTAARYIPEVDDEIHVSEFDIDPETEGITPERIRVELDGTGERRYIEGKWEGDTDLFREQPFSLYVVEILEGNKVIRRSDASIRGIRYNWGSKQTRDSLYVTRQPSVSSEWTAEFDLTGVPRELEPIEAEHLPDKNVFRVDLAKFNVSAGQYQGHLEITNGEPGLENIYLSIGRMPLIIT